VPLNSQGVMWQVIIHCVFVLSAIALGGETLGLLTVIGALLILGATLWGLFDVKREGTSP